MMMQLLALGRAEHAGRYLERFVVRLLLPHTRVDLSHVVRYDKVRVHCRFGARRFDVYGLLICRVRCNEAAQLRIDRTSLPTFSMAVRCPSRRTVGVATTIALFGVVTFRCAAVVISTDICIRDAHADGIVIRVHLGFTTFRCIVCIPSDRLALVAQLLQLQMTPRVGSGVF